MATSHRDYYEDLADALAHNDAPAFPLQAGGDSWQGALCARHALQARSRFGRGHSVVCTNANCPAQCSVCAMEFEPRGQVA